MTISDDLMIYGAYARVTESCLAIAKEAIIDIEGYAHMKSKMEKWIGNIFNTFESEMIRKNKEHYRDLIGVLREKINMGFKDIFDRLEGKSLEAIIK